VALDDAFSPPDKRGNSATRPITPENERPVISSAVKESTSKMSLQDFLKAVPADKARAKV